MRVASPIRSDYRAMLVCSLTAVTRMQAEEQWFTAPDRPAVWYGAASCPGRKRYTVKTDLTFIKKIAPIPAPLGRAIASVELKSAAVKNCHTL
jgi:hypothetical protein